MKNLSNGKLKNFSSKVKKQIDKCFNSPTLTKNLVNTSDESFETPKSSKKKSKIDKSEPGAILRQGIKFANEAEFDEYMTPNKYSDPNLNKSFQKCTQCGNFRIFLIFQILREIIFGESGSAKSAILTNLEALNFDVLRIFAIFGG